MITRADKGQTLIIITKEAYESKVHDFLHNNAFVKISKDPTTLFSRETRKTVNACKTLIPEHLKWKYTHMNPHPPNIRGLLKIHKSEAPIRPVVNWQHAPAYKLAKLLSDRLQYELQLPYTFNVKNSIHLMSELKNIVPYNSNIRLASFDISNMYTNIPTTKLPTLITEICNNLYIPKRIRIELIKLVKTVLQQNYFSFQNDIFKQTTGLAMGAPTSAIFSEIYLQYIEHTLIIDILKNNNIIEYLRYVDDILIVYNKESTNIDTVLEQFNNLTNNLNFTIEKEHNNRINFLDTTIHRRPQKFEFAIYRKPTTTDHIIPNDSCHPPSHKLSAIRFLTNRLNTYPISKQSKEVESIAIRHILHANKYNDLPPPQKYRKQTDHTEPTPQKKRAIFTYFGHETTKITNIFHKLGIQIAFKTKHTIGSLLQHSHNTQDKFQNNGVYQLTCPTCEKVYIGQTGRSFATRFKEHERDYHTNCKKSLFAKHLLEQQHHPSSMEECMSILETQRKSRKLNTLEQFHIYTAVKIGNHLNEQYTDTHNAIFESILKHYPHLLHPQ
jgi:hypothetical protein